MAGVVLKFQSTPPRRGATRCSSDLRWVPQNFNPRPREGGRRQADRRALSWLRFQSTPPRGGATANIFTRYSPAFISIHAPARGGDDVESLAQYKASLFQSTPPRGGATYAGGAGSQSVIHFNPRPREGGDYHAYYYHTFQSQISIHAPARGATRLVPDLGQVAVISIHAPARGATSGNKSFLWVYLYFNPRPREGGDPPRLHAQGSGQVFQSTPPRGGRLTGSATVTYGGLISIHAPARGATTWRGQKSRSCWISIHAPARGATFRQPLHGHYAGISIHAPARGATVETYVLISRKLLFQSTPPRGGRPLHGRLLHHSAVISIHAPARGATAKMHSFTCGSLTNK